MEREIKCTWKNCKNDAIYSQVAKDGEVWANLCEEHHNLLEECISDIENPKKLLGAWIKAQGGAKRAAGRMV